MLCGTVYVWVDIELWNPWVDPLKSYSFVVVMSLWDFVVWLFLHRASIFQIIRYQALLLIKAMGGPQDVAPWEWQSQISGLCVILLNQSAWTRLGRRRRSYALFWMPTKKNLERFTLIARTQNSTHTHQHQYTPHSQRSVLLLMQTSMCVLQVLREFSVECACRCS